jgi:catechol 2,3-dioxygenase-like lactoylglutathione lyase family enzyme
MAGITLDHIALMVSDLEKSLDFYRDLLGFELLSPEEHIGGPVAEMVKVPDVHMREYRLVPPGGVNGYQRGEGAGQITLDLIQWITPESPRERYPIHHVPSAHICFGVEDLPAVYERLKDKVEFVSPPVRFTGEGEWHVLFFYDPDGNLIELVQPKG